MKSQDVLLLITTCVMGFVFGMYAFFTGYSPMARVVETQVEEWTGELVIVGEAYGGCSRLDTCPTFRIASNGSYRYFYYPSGARDAVLREGEISRTQLAALRRVASEDDLQVSSRPTNPAFCESYTDGIDVRYVVTRDGVDYRLDSCGTDVQSDGELWQTLSQLWTYFERGGE